MSETTKAATKAATTAAKRAAAEAAKQAANEVNETLVEKGTETAISTAAKTRDIRIFAIGVAATAGLLLARKAVETVLAKREQAEEENPGHRESVA